MKNPRARARKRNSQPTLCLTACCQVSSSVLRSPFFGSKKCVRTYVRNHGGGVGLLGGFESGEHGTGKSTTILSGRSLSTFYVARYK